jgi:Dyp-type peroxidase family
MTMPFIDELSQPISTNTHNHEIQSFLGALQGNILKGHGRHHTANIFCKFPAGKVANAKAFLKGLATSNMVRSAKAQLADAQAFKAARAAGDPPLVTPAFYAALISKAGYDYLGIPQNKQPKDLAFQAGLKNRVPERPFIKLHDPAPNLWEVEYQQTYHAMILIGETSPAKLQFEVSRLMGRLGAQGLTAGGTFHNEVGSALFNDAGEGLENFGYVDGRSQPLMLIEDIAHEAHEMDGIDNWSPAFGPAQVVVDDPGAADETACGSYFVFRKLEQNVKKFKISEEALGDKLGLGEAAGALVVGRYEDGTPIALSPVATMGAPVLNNFHYDQEPPNAISPDRGPRCPFQAHVRKTNPRTDDTRAATMARRGITYGERGDTHLSSDGRTILDAVANEDRPTGGVGLLFMAYQASIPDQFEVVQGLWANNSGFPVTAPGQPIGIDPVIGQGPSVPQDWPKGWGKPTTESHDFYKVAPGTANNGPFVTMKGGEYFFAPSLVFLRGL